MSKERVETNPEKKSGEWQADCERAAQRDAEKKAMMDLLIFYEKEGKEKKGRKQGQGKRERRKLHEGRAHLISILTLQQWFQPFLAQALWERTLPEVFSFALSLPVSLLDTQLKGKGGKKNPHTTLHTGTVNMLHSTGQPVPVLDTRLDKLVNELSELCELCGWTRDKHHAVCFFVFCFFCCVSMISLPPSPLYPCLRTIHLFLPWP